MFTIRVAAHVDVKNIAAVINAAFEVERPMRMNAERTSPQKVQELMGGGDTFFVAEQEDRIIGSVFVRTTGSTGYFGMLAVDPTLQRSGIGHALRTHAEDFAKQHGCTVMTLTTGDFRAELLPYYNLAGYKVVSTEPGPPEWGMAKTFHVIHMAKPL